MSDATLRAFFTVYGNALATGDIATIAASYALPAIVLADEGSIPLGNPDQIAAAAHSAADRYHVQGIVSIHPRLTRVDPISATLTSADVSWLYERADGRVVFEEAYRYIVRLDDARPLIQVVVRRPAP